MFLIYTYIYCESINVFKLFVIALHLLDYLVYRIPFLSPRTLFYYCHLCGEFVLMTFLLRSHAPRPELAYLSGQGPGMVHAATRV